MQREAPDLEAAAALVTEVWNPMAMPTRTAYAHTGSEIFEVRIVPLSDVQCFERGPGVPGLVRDRALSLLDALRTSMALPPVNVYLSKDKDAPFRYRLYHGYHRFHLSLAVGYTHIPVAINHLAEAGAA